MSDSDPVRIKEPIKKHEDEDDDYGFDLTDRLEGTTITSISGTDPRGKSLGATISPATNAPTIDAVEVNSSALTINNRTVAIGKGISITLYGGTATTEPQTFEIKCVYRTADGRTLTSIGTLILTPG